MTAPLIKRFPNLGNLSIALLEHMVRPLLGDKALEEIKAPVTEREIQDTLAKTLETTEKRFISEYSDRLICEAVLSLPLSNIPSVKQAALIFMSKPNDNSLPNILVEQITANFRKLPKEDVIRGVQKYQNI